MARENAKMEGKGRRRNSVCGRRKGACSPLLYRLKKISEKSLKKIGVSLEKIANSTIDGEAIVRQRLVKALTMKGMFKERGKRERVKEDPSP